MARNWKRDEHFDYDRFNHHDDYLTDNEIDALRQEPGRLSRLIGGIVGVVRRGSSVEKNVQHVSLPGAELINEDFSRRVIRDANFVDADLRRASFADSVVEHGRFSCANLQGANLANANFHGSDLSGANLEGANLIGADLTFANLRNANLSGAYLWGADFNDADVADAVFTGAYAGGALFSRAKNLRLDQFRSTIHDETGAYRLSSIPDQPQK